MNLTKRKERDGEGKGEKNVIVIGELHTEYRVFTMLMRVSIISMTKNHCYR